MLSGFNRWLAPQSAAEKQYNQDILGVAPLFTPMLDVSGTAFTFQRAHCGLMLMTQSAASVQVTIPNEDAQQFPEFAELCVVQDAAGLVTVVGAAGVTIRKKDDTDGITNGFGGMIVLKRKARNIWNFYGDYT